MSRNAETAFLPAVLEIEVAPPSPIGRAILWTILALFSMSIVWATLGEVDIVAIAQGQIIPSGHSKTVQPLGIGTVSAIHVREGQRVHAGEVLIELDPTSTTADVDRLTVEQHTAAREMARYRQLTAWLQAQREPGTQIRPVTDDPLLYRQWREFESRLAILAREQEKQRAERQTALRQVEKLESLLPIIARRARDQQALAEQKLLPEQQYLETEQERLKAFHDLRAHQSRVSELDAAIQELESRIGFTRNEFHRQTLERFEDAERRHAIAQQDLIKAETRARAQLIKAPVDGVVQQLAIHNVGAVVTPAQALMIIVPQEDVLEVEAFLQNKDIGFVEVGQSARIKIDAFPFTKYGTIAGKIVGLSNDAVADERRGLEYKMRVSLERSQIQVNDKSVMLSPGMTVTVESKMGTRRMIEYFLSPLLRYKDESVRER